MYFLILPPHPPFRALSQAYSESGGDMYGYGEPHVGGGVAGERGYLDETTGEWVDAAVAAGDGDAAVVERDGEGGYYDEGGSWVEGGGEAEEGGGGGAGGYYDESGNWIDTSGEAW